jgi:hypothetical protein
MADLACKIVNGDGEYNLRAVNSLAVDPNYISNVQPHEIRSLKYKYYDCNV